MTSAESPQAQTALAPLTDRAPATYGGRAEVRALATRIMAIHPAARSIGERGCLLLAQLGLALGLNPLPGTGHIHAWMDDGQLCVHVGLEGRLALARRQSTFSYTTRPMRAEEAQEHDLKPGQRGSVCELTRHDLTREEMALKLPITRFVGIGIANPTERVAKGRTLAWRATQRAIKDAIRQAFGFDLPGELADAVRLEDNEAEVPADVIEGTAAAAGPAPQPAPIGDDEETPAPSAGTAPPDRPYPPAYLREALASIASGNDSRPANQKQRGLLAAMLDLCFAGADDASKRRHTVTAWLFGCPSTSALAAGQVHAALEWLKPEKDSGGMYVPDPVAAREAAAVLAQALADAGQLQLDLEGEPMRN